MHIPPHTLFIAALTFLFLLISNLKSLANTQLSVPRSSIITKSTMKFFQSSTSETQLSDFKHATSGKCVPGVLRRLPCFHGHASHHHIKETTELCNATTNPGIVARLMGLDSIPQRNNLAKCKEDRGNLNSRSQTMSKTPMVLELENGKFFVLGFEAGIKGKGDSRSNSKRKLSEDNESKKKKLATETSNSNEASKTSANVDFELEFLDQLVLELVYIF